MRARQKWAIVSSFILIVCILWGCLSNRSYARPEDVYKGQYLAEPDIVVFGACAALTVGARNGNVTQCYVLKHGARWKVAPVHASTWEVALPCDDFSISFVPESKNEDGYFVIIGGYYGGDELVIQDTETSIFQCLYIRSNKAEQDRYNYYSYIQKLDESYVLTINGVDYPVLALWNSTQGTVLH